MNSHNFNELTVLYNGYGKKQFVYSPQHTFKLEKTKKQNRFQELHHPDDHELVKFVIKYFVSINLTLGLYHGLLRNKKKKILLELASGFCQHTFRLEKTNKQNRFQELHHPEDHELVKFVKFFFFYLDFAASPRGF